MGTRRARDPLLALPPARVTNELTHVARPGVPATSLDCRSLHCARGAESRYFGAYSVSGTTDYPSPRPR